MVADVELRAAGDARTPGGADGSGARARETAKPRRSRALSRRACRELCVEGAGDCGRAATAGRRWLPPPLPVHLVHGALPRTTGRAPPAGRSPHPAAGFPSRGTHALINNQLGPEARNTRDKCLGQRKVGSVRGGY